ncbi:nicotinate (nicotinamide) nucleotide adenylyltransferase [Microgenomates group bacterium RIFCSPLOWO2_01_FULL_46_13]|nr:MAG: nicotinate (nicotinamide) nucleotide adenylyltransferase [Microgenomates group bacterium RIFCSPHIGHO2_01_FULL_45_11]OGV94188.1 MAG: nicotinate (nicotinamide) nucleotide adenylyltransferase [Microgenomates group bacterium RIFCSPLOWO2_01_FULL_46_13]
MQIVLFGGSFNPPHLGHLLVIEQAFELIGKIDELWLLPAFKHTFQKELAPASDRLAMAELLIAELADGVKKRTRLETIECDKRLSGETLETVNILYKMYPGKTFSFLMGSDQLPTFTKWGHYQELLKLLPFYVYPRSGSHNSITYPNMTLLQSPTQVVTNLSSTIIRERLQQHLSIAKLVPKAVANYINSIQLYDNS